MIKTFLRIKIPRNLLIKFELFIAKNFLRVKILRKQINHEDFDHDKNVIKT